MHLIGGGYHDCEADDYENEDETDDEEEDCWELFYARDKQYEDLYRRSVAIVAGLLGPGRVISTRDLDFRNLDRDEPEYSHFKQDMPAVLLDSCDDDEGCIAVSSGEFHGLEFTWWKTEGRLVLLHYVSATGDGDFQFAVSLCVLPDQEEPGQE